MNAPSKFQKMIDGVLQGSPFAIDYSDDFIIFSKSIVEHVGHCKEVCERIKKEKLKINVTKCVFAKSELNLLAHVVNAVGVKLDDDTIKDILETPAAKNVTDLRSFLGLALYYLVSRAALRGRQWLRLAYEVNVHAFQKAAIPRKLCHPSWGVII